MFLMKMDFIHIQTLLISIVLRDVDVNRKSLLRTVILFVKVWKYVLIFTLYSKDSQSLAIKTLYDW